MLFWLRSRAAQGRIDMSLDDLLREVIATGKLREPFTASDAARVLSLNDWEDDGLEWSCLRNILKQASSGLAGSPSGTPNGGRIRQVDHRGHDCWLPVLRLT